MIRPFRLRIAYCPFYKCVKQIDANYFLFLLTAITACRMTR